MSKPRTSLFRAPCQILSGCKILPQFTVIVLPSAMDMRTKPTLENELALLRAAMDASADAIYLVDRATMQFIDVNETACKRMGYTRQELLALGPHDLLNASRQELERQYDAVIAAGETGTTTESPARTKTRKRSVTELHRRALRWNDRWVIVSIARDVTRRKRAEKAVRRLERMYAALSETNEAILYSETPVELLQRVCDAALNAASFISGVTAYTINVDTGYADVAAIAGTHQQTVRETLVSIDENRPEGRGLIGTAFRTLKTCVSNDFLSDKRLGPWHERAREMGRLAAIAVPLTSKGRAAGVLHFAADEVGVFDDEIVKLLERLGKNVSFALGGMEREAERKQVEEQIRAAEQQFRGLVEQSIAGIYIVQDRKFAYVNQRYAEIFGYASSDELIGREAFTVVSEKDRVRTGNAIREQLKQGSKTVSYSFTGIRKDGSSIEAGAHGARATHLGRPAVIGLMQDITEKARAEEEIRRYVEELKTTFMSTVKLTMTLSEARDAYTAGHERRVAEIAVAIAMELGLDARLLEGLRVAGYLHDVGKISIPAEILAKPGKLSSAEFELVKGHARTSYDILKTVAFPWPVAEAAHQHHERLDGSGYPQGLKGDAIILEARILAVADIVEAMASHRPYRAGLGLDAALAQIERSRGTHLDPQAVDACLRLFRQKGFRLPQ